MRKETVEYTCDNCGVADKIVDRVIDDVMERYPVLKKMRFLHKNTELEMRKVWVTIIKEELGKENCTNDKENFIQLQKAVEELLDFVEEPPSKNCSCHINPPCTDCVEYSGLREALEKVRKCLK